MNLSNRYSVPLSLLLVFGFLADPASSDPLPGRDILKFSQLPMDGTAISVDIPGGAVTTGLFYGHDEFSTAYATGDTGSGETNPVYTGFFMADDFADRFASPVVHVKWWGSYLENNIQQSVDKFLISFEADVPDPDEPHEGPGFSRPGEPLLNQIVTRAPAAVGLFPGSGTYTEKPISPGGAPLFEDLYEYNAELHLDKEFFQEPDTVYWLKIVALVDVPEGIDPFQTPTAVTRWGWHNRDYTIPNPLASTPPAVVPGEHLDNPLVDPAYPAPVYHFQDNSVTGEVIIDAQENFIMPDVFQNEATMKPNFYLDGIDGFGPDSPAGSTHGGIGQFSKDLAFELYTIPEPTTFGLLVLGLTVALVRTRGNSIY